MHLSHHGTRLKNSVIEKSGSCICTHSRTAISISSLLWNQQCPKCCFSGPDKWQSNRGRVKDYRVDGPQVTPEMTVTALMFDMCCVRLHVMLKGHTSRLTSRSQIAWHRCQRITASVQIACRALTHEFNMAEPCCITEYRLTHFEFFGCRRSTVFPCVPTFLLEDWSGTTMSHHLSVWIP